MLAYGGTWATNPAAGMPEAVTAISSADSAAAGTRSRPSGPRASPGASRSSRDAVAISGTGRVWATAAGHGAKADPRDDVQVVHQLGDVRGQLLPAQVGLGAREDQQVASGDPDVAQRQLRT